MDEGEEEEMRTYVLLPVIPSADTVPSLFGSGSPNLSRASITGAKDQDVP